MPGTDLDTRRLQWKRGFLRQWVQLTIQWVGEWERRQKINKRIDDFRVWKIFAIGYTWVQILNIVTLDFYLPEAPGFVPLKTLKTGTPGWLSPLSVQLWLRSWSHGSQVWVPTSGSALSGRSLRGILSLPLTAPPPLEGARACTHMLPLLLTLNKLYFFKKTYIFAVQMKGIYYIKHIAWGLLDWVSPL